MFKYKPRVVASKKEPIKLTREQRQIQREERRRLRKEKEELQKLQAAADEAAAINNVHDEGINEDGNVEDKEETGEHIDATPDVSEDNRAEKIFTADDDLLEQANKGQDRLEKKHAEKKINQGSDL